MTGGPDRPAQSGAPRRGRLRLWIAALAGAASLLAIHVLNLLAGPLAAGPVV